MALETQYSGLDWGFKLSYEGYGASAQQIWPSVPGFLQATEMLFGTLFFWSNVGRVRLDQPMLLRDQRPTSRRATRARPSRFRRISELR